RTHRRYCAPSPKPCILPRVCHPAHSPQRSALVSSAATSSTNISTLSLHDALPISAGPSRRTSASPRAASPATRSRRRARWSTSRSEEHTSELQSHLNLVCRLLLEKKKNENGQPSRLGIRHEEHTHDVRVCGD